MGIKSFLGHTVETYPFAYLLLVRAHIIWNFFSENGDQKCMYKIWYGLFNTVKSGKTHLFALEEIALYLYPIK